MWIHQHKSTHTYRIWLENRADRASSVVGTYIFASVVVSRCYSTRFLSCSHTCFARHSSPSIFQHIFFLSSSSFIHTKFVQFKSFRNCLQWSHRFFLFIEQKKKSFAWNQPVVVILKFGTTFRWIMIESSYKLQKLFDFSRFFSSQTNLHEIEAQQL